MDKDRRRELREQFDQIKTYMGVIKVTNTANGKVFISGFPNLKNKWMTLSAQLNGGTHPNGPFLQDWNKFGADAFTYEILEQKSTDKVTDVRWEMKMMEKTWINKLQSFGEKGYNKPPEDR